MFERRLITSSQKRRGKPNTIRIGLGGASSASLAFGIHCGRRMYTSSPSGVAISS